MNSTLITAIRQMLPRVIVRGVAYTGGIIIPNVWMKDGTRKDGPFVVNLSTLTIPPSVPIRFEHDDTETIGEAFSAVMGNELYILRGLVDLSSLRARRAIARKYRFSIGIRGGTIYTIPADSEGGVNGRVVRGPLMVATHSTLDEISYVKDPADDPQSPHDFSNEKNPKH